MACLDKLLIGQVLGVCERRANTHCTTLMMQFDKN